MKVLYLPVLPACLFISLSALGQEWKNECVGYYQLVLPDNLEVALYPVEDFISPRNKPESDGDIKVQLYASPKITFGKNSYIQDVDSVQAQFTEFYYGPYMLGISSQSHTTIDWLAYRKRVADNRDFETNVIRQYEKRSLKLVNKAVTPESEFKRRYSYVIKDYSDAFALYENRTYSLYIKKDEHLYHFWKRYQKDTGDKSQTAEKYLKESEPEVLSLLSRFQPRKLYEVPTEQGFCMPYGFIANDSGNEKRNMAVTYRMKEHPDVTIFFQDLGPASGPGERRPDQAMSAKDYVTYFWNVRYGHSFREVKLYGKGFSSQEIDGRKAVSAFAKFTRFSKEVDYGYVAFVKGTTDDKSDLLFYVMRDSRQVKNQPPMDKGELEKMAEHIVSSVKRRK